MDTKTQSAYQEELQRLEETNIEIDKQLARLRATPVYYGPDLTEQALEVARENGRNNLAKAVEEPYFGRLDFQESGTASSQPLYIGKSGVEDERTGQLLVIDWRAPVASLFYSFTGGLDAASYDSPDGLIEGLVYLKRNLVVRKQILQRVVDTYDRNEDSLAVGDEFLLYRLGENKDNKLRDIVSTIQAEQDRIIRAAKNTALIIQGVAGSGKTTVALHRLAFLLYQYREQVRAERMIIFAPNSMFLDYISGVLPELGVGNIQQSTFTDWALDVLEQEVKLADQALTLQTWFSLGSKRPPLDDNAPGRFKGSIAFKQYLDDCLTKFESSYVPTADFIPWEGVKLPLANIREWFFVENKHYPLVKRRERVVARIKRWMEMQLDKIWEQTRKKELKKKSAQRLRTYLTSWSEHSAFSFYKMLFAENNRPESLPVELLHKLPEPIVSASLKLFKKKEVQLEDLAPLLHIHTRLYGISSDRLFDHVVIDEAQDFSPFQVAVLDSYTRNSSFTILGDLSQGIHAYQGIKDWKEFSSLFQEEQGGYFELERSYRSTMEIIQFANLVLQRGVENPLLAVPVFRSGNKVRVLQTDLKQRIPLLLQAIATLQQGTSSTIAVVARTEKQAEDLHDVLTKAGIETNLITSKQRVYRGGISVVPVYLTKGLEFDAVLLMDVTAAHYEATLMDAKLLYVGCTRALHELWLMAPGDLSPLVSTDDADIVTTDSP
ncbi:AAA family ATPase [Paenibacillus sp. CGMCC 1.16610]|uniref:DNA 3'-5' helicase n=1 Tax=Paenibacillus anseongense TaxID=2682845 RepID=A0ABW9UMD0_9BACL|nr:MULTISPECIES: 3'-5' exonuclease [Paenibacillus]MBA2941604.1 AAA family ATPase [Paenibacillus sp. CGMCC 1.16610]MVQ40417.1 AAA family ATPase [Paenibacillus anseongense]